MAIHRLAKRENWRYQERAKKDGGRLWLIASMPRPTQQILIQAVINHINNDIASSQAGAGQAVIPAHAGLAGGNEAEPPFLYGTLQNSVNKEPDKSIFNGTSGRAEVGGTPGRIAPPVCQADGQPGPPALYQPLIQLTDKQRAVMDARMAFVHEIKRLSGITGGKSMAIHALVLSAKVRQLPTRLQALLNVANDRSRPGRTLSVRTLFNWCALAEKGPAALAPGYKRPDMSIPIWLPEFMRFYQQPQKPSINEAYREFFKVWPNQPPSVHAVKRYLQKISPVDKERGRRGPHALKEIQPFVRRDTSKLLPCSIYSADGHTFDAEVSHPENGRPFRPEVTMVIDVATRRVVGFSITLSENALAVIDALSMAVKSSGVCSIFYVDRGPGYANDILKAPGVGLVDRLGMTITHSLPRNSQARGIIERGHRTILVSLARTMATNVNKAMDAEAKQVVFKLTRKEFEQAGRSRYLMSWDEFRAKLAGQIAAYNDHPHSGLPKIWDESINKRRHLSPNEMLAHFVFNGWKPMMLSDSEADDLFRPYEKRMVRRGEVRLLNNIYFDKALTDFHGEIVRVGYNVADASQVWVRDNQGRLICVAKLNGNRRDYYPQSALEQANEKRRKAQEKRHEQKLANIRVVQVIDVEYSAEEREQVKQIMNAPAANPKATRPGCFWTEDERYRWLAGHLNEWNESDQPWLEEYVSSQRYKDLYEIYQRENIAWEQVNKNPKLQESGLCATSL